MAGREEDPTKNSATAAPTMISVKRNKTPAGKCWCGGDHSRFPAPYNRYCASLRKPWPAQSFSRFADAQGFFAGCAVGSHTSLPKRRAIWTDMTSMATPVNKK